MTLIGRRVGNHTVELWQLVAPTVGKAEIVATFSGTVQAVGGSASFNGVDQSIPTGSFQSTGGTGTKASLNVTSAAGELVIDALFANDGPDASVGADQASQWNDATGSGNGTVTGAGSIEAGGASVPMTWSFSSSKEWELAAVSLKPVSTNTAPVIGLPGSAVNFTENDGATVIDAAATVIDADGGDLETGTLTVDFSAGGTANDRLAIRNEGTGAGRIGVSGSNVSYEGTTIGTFTDGTNGSTPLVITFNANSTPTAAQALMRNITFENVSEAPSELARTVRFVITDGDGGTSNAGTQTVNLTAVNDAPTANIVASAFDVREDDEYRLFGGFSVSDVDAGGADIEFTLSVGQGIIRLIPPD
ncbi:MAG: hypothetical protein O3A00_19345 [Planctomycetota bacterium]|nr:hypothetical protein [Planctomycetota bacterium]